MSRIRKIKSGSILSGTSVHVMYPVTDQAANDPEVQRFLFEQAKADLSKRPIKSGVGLINTTASIKKMSIGGMFGYFSQRAFHIVFTFGNT